MWKDVSGNRIYFLYADEGLIGEYDSSGNEIKTYGYAPNSTWTTNPLFQKVGTNYYWYQNDHLGTPQKLIDTSGRTVWLATYDSFGKIQITISEIENNLRFPGQYYDAETGLHYNYHRDYSPEIGRYVEVDPIGIEEGVNHLYVYVGNNPVNKIDLLGLFSYNNPEPRTGRLKGKALDLANCMEKCIGKSFVVTGGSECTPDGRHIPGSEKGSKHCTNQAFDMWPSGMDKTRVFCCAKGCGAKYIKNEGNHWHFQTSVGKKGGSGVLPKDEDCVCKIR